MAVRLNVRTVFGLKKGLCTVVRVENEYKGWDAGVVVRFPNDSFHLVDCCRHEVSIPRAAKVAGDM